MYTVIQASECAAAARWPRHLRGSFSPQRVQLDCLATALGKRLVSSPECAAGLPSHGMMDLIVPSKNQMQKSAIPVTELLHKEAFAMAAAARIAMNITDSYDYSTFHSSKQLIAVPRIACQDVQGERAVI
jgi:hypothetical protein